MLIWNILKNHHISLSFFDIAAISSAISSEDNFMYSMKVFWVLWPLTCIIWRMVYLWLRYILVMPVRRAVWLVTHS